MTPSPQVAEIEERLAKATPGPWEWDGTVWEYDKEQEAPWLNDREGNRILWGEINAHERDAVFIKNSPADIAYLLAERKKLMAVVEAVKEFKRETDIPDLALAGRRRKELYDALAALEKP